VSWLGVSIVLSVVLTILLNIALRLFPDAGRRMNERLNRLAEHEEPSQSGVRVIFPWKAMLLASLLLTLAINVLLLLFR
jgi:hypothetical protein